MNEQALWLAIDTSTATMAGAVTRGEQLLSSVQTASERNHSIHIMTNIEKLLKSSGTQLHELDGIITGIGPGSYTGVRIAVTAAKTLAWTSGKPLVGVSSLAALALSGYLSEVEDRGKTLVLPLMDARRGQVYTAAFQLQTEREQCTRLHQDHIVLMEDWCAHWVSQFPMLLAKGVTSVAFYGDVMLHEASITSFTDAAVQHGITVQSAPHQMMGKALALLGQGSWLKEQIVVAEPHELVPNYAQLTEAEVKQNAKEREEGKG